MKKGFLTGILLAAVLASGCAQNNAPAPAPTPDEGGLKAGTYTATVPGRNGDLTAETIIEDGKITSVTVTEHSETAGVADGALEKVPARIVEMQTPYVDAVSGATITSEAIMEAVKNCLIEAGADEAFFAAGQSEAGEKEKETLNTDIVIVGGGMSGMSAAIAAATNGADVIVLEKLDRTGGSAMFCSGNFAAYNTASEAEQGIEDSRELALQHWEERQSQSIEDMGTINYDRIGYVLDNTADTIAWYTDLGVEFEPSKAPSTGNLSTTRAVGKGAALVKKMEEIARNAGVTIMLETPASELITEDGAVVGVRAADAHKEYEVYGSYVILACGGYAADHDELSAKVPLYEKAISLASAGNTGDGVEMALKAGAVEYDNPWAIAYTIQPAAEIKAAVPEAKILTDDRHNGIFADKAVVDQDGKRFVDESQQYSVVSINLAYSSHDNFLILDSEDAEVAAVMDKCLETGKVFKGETLEELAKNAGIGEALAETIAAYNEAAAGEGDMETGKKADKMTAYGEGPYYAVVYYPGTTGTLGGVKTDYEGHVLNKDGGQIEGLYAIGEMSNREYYNQTYIGASSVSFSATMGRLVGTALAESLK